MHNQPEWELVATCSTMSEGPGYVIDVLSDEDDDGDEVEILEFRQETQNLLNNPSNLKIVKKLNDVECPICFDEVTNATVTSCGHIFCLDCIQQSISSSSARGQTRGKRGVGLCPLCRKRVNFKDTTVLRIKISGKIEPPPLAKDVDAPLSGEPVNS